MERFVPLRERGKRAARRRNGRDTARLFFSGEI